MSKRNLSDYFIGIAAKRLSKVEAEPDSSHQHEFNGVAGFKQIFGEARNRFSADFVYFSDSEDDTLISKGFVTWYDAREAHPVRSEYRLYFPSNSVTNQSSAGDLVIIGKKPDNTLVVIIGKAGSTAENQLLWIFQLQDQHAELFSHFMFRTVEDERAISYAESVILEQVGIEVDEIDNSYLDIMLENFPEGFPPTKVFSEFARNTLDEIDSRVDPDHAVMMFMEREEMLFKTLEAHIVSGKLKAGFEDVEEFISFSLSVQNRRKSRSGYAFENHLEFIFSEHGLRFSRNQITENKAKPDFIFPGIKEYHDDGFPSDKLVMLGVKTTCKDRWRQILTEAKKITLKHLSTLEPGISNNQTDEMMSHNLQLVVPKELHDSYSLSQAEWLMNISDFIIFARNRQSE